MSEKFLNKFRDINTIKVYLKIAIWVIPLSIFGPILLINGLYAAALLTAFPGFIVTYFIFKRAILNFSPDRQHSLAKILFIENFAIAIAAVYLICFIPLDGNWIRLGGTENWSDPSLVHIDSNKYAAFCSHNGFRKIMYTENSGTTWEDCHYTGGDGKEIAFHKKRNDIWAGPVDNTVIYRYSLTTRKWDSIVRIPGEMERFTLSEKKGFLTTRKKLYIFHMEKDEWKLFSFTDSNIKEAVQSEGDNSVILIVGKNWLQSTDNGKSWEDVKPVNAKMTDPSIAVGGNGWRYIYEEGFLTGTLYVGPPNKSFEKRELPASDVSIMIANPEDGSEIWMGTSGHGVYHSTDGGHSWQYKGLKKIQVNTMAVDFFKREVLAGSSSLLFDKGIYRTSY